MPTYWNPYKYDTWCDNTVGWSSSQITYTMDTSAYNQPVAAPKPKPEPTVIDWLRGRVAEITELAWSA